MDTRQQSGTAGDNQTTSSAQRGEYLRNKAISAAIDDGESVAGAARRYGVSRQWACKIKRRWDAGAESIAARLGREGVRPPANSTVHRILVSAGLVRPEPGKRPKASYTRFEASLPN